MSNNLKDIFDLVKDDKNFLVGLKNIEFSFLTKTEGVINWNGNNFGTQSSFKAEDKFVNNIRVPKVSNPPTKTIFLSNPDFEDAKLLISAECFKQAMYSKESFGLNNITKALPLLCSAKGLLNGFVVANIGALRTSPCFLSKLHADFECSDKEKEVLNCTDYDELNNGKLKYEIKTQANQVDIDEKTGNVKKAATSYFGEINNLLKNNYFKSKGVIDLEKLQFIPIAGELGRDSLGASTEKEAEELREMLEIYINNVKEEVLTSKVLFKQPCFFKWLDNLKNEEVKVELGKYRQIGGVAQLLNDKLLETGLLLNETAQKVMVLKYFDLLLNTTILKTNATLEVINLEITTNLNQNLIKSYLKVEE